MEERPTCYKCGGHITNKAIEEADKHHNRWGGLFRCDDCQREVEEKYADRKKFWHKRDRKWGWVRKSLRLQRRMLEGKLKKR